MKQRLYIDTSVFGGYFDEEFSEFTKPLFERLQNEETGKHNKARRLTISQDYSV